MRRFFPQMEVRSISVAVSSFFVRVPPLVGRAKMFTEVSVRHVATCDPVHALLCFSCTPLHSQFLKYFVRLYQIHQGELTVLKKWDVARN